MSIPKAALGDTGRETLAKRMRSRGEGKDSFAEQQLEGCLYAFENLITDAERIWNDDMSISDTAEEIAKRCGIALKPKTNAFQRFVYRLKVTVKHIRQ